MLEMMEWSAMMKNDFSETYWRDYVYELKCFKWEGCDANDDKFVCLCEKLYGGI